LDPTERRKTEAGAAATAYRRWTRRRRRRDAEVASFYSRALHGGNAGLRKGEQEVTARRGGRAGVRSRGAESNEAAKGIVKGTQGERILSLRWRRDSELDREGADSGHATRMGVPAHGDYATRARELEVRWAARGVSKEGGSRGTARGLVAGCSAPASWRRSGLDSGLLVQQGDATPRRQCGLPTVHKRGGRRRDVTAAHRGLDGAPWRGAWPEFQLRAARRGADVGGQR
jgi:hypothetical protein